MNRVLFFFVAVGINGAFAQTPPAITNTPVIDTAPLLLWPLDRPAVKPNLSNPTSNELFDLHGDLDCSSADLVFSTEGNYNMALQELWFTELLPNYGADVKTWFYTTSPPVFPDQVPNKRVEIGQFRLECLPSVVVGGKQPLSKITASIDGPTIPLDKSRGMVLLVKKGNPKNIRSVWDLGRRDVRYVTPNPTLESGAFGNYSDTIYGIALNDPNPPLHLYRGENDGFLRSDRGEEARCEGDKENNGEKWTADRLYNAVFNNTCVPDKWLAGARIHHRDVPWSIAYGKADAGMLLYHLALYTVQSFPDQFEIIPLGGTVDNPQPLPGTVIASASIAKIKGNWSARQIQARNDLINLLTSSTFTLILQKHGLTR